MSNEKPKSEETKNCRIGHTTLSEGFIYLYCLARECRECKFFLTKAEAGINQKQVKKIPNQRLRSQIKYIIFFFLY
ncbi:hypothetical protein LCGC14_3168270 [marine sediment metagenome]|uniref:Uncharacterized protein n=1 Tax=marine sediment metagenome TaxID=412755 RepID=A0A0F8VGQ7_9ZZZZ